LFTAAIVLLMNVWNSKKSGQEPFPRREIEVVQRCMAILKKGEKQ